MGGFVFFSVCAIPFGSDFKIFSPSVELLLYF